MPSPRGIPGNLPADLTSFVGRQEDLRTGRQLLSETRLLTLMGPGGVGKTRLALRLAASVRRAFPDGVWLVELDQVADPRLLVQTVATTLGLRERASDWPAELLRTHLASRHLLLVLDNCEHLIDGCRKLTDQLLRECQYLRVLATSRESFGILPEVTFPVSPLPVPVAGNAPQVGEPGQVDAVRLFLDRARQVAPGFRLTDENRAVISQVCQRLDGLPLAIELAAARVRVLEPQQILARLEPPYTLLKRPSGSSSDRHRTMLESIRWSYDLCAGVEQQLWQRLATFSGGFELEAAEIVGADEDLALEDVLDAVTALVDKSVAVRLEDLGTCRLRMLEVIRTFGLDRLRESGHEVAVRRRHRGYYEDLVGRMASDWVSSRQGDWLARIDVEHANLRAALDFSLTDPDGAEHTLAILATLPHYYWWTRGLLAEGRYWLGKALAEVPPGAAPSPLLVRALLLDCQLAVGQGAFDPRRFRTASRLAQQLGDPRTLALADYVEGIGALWAAGDFPTARSALERAARTAAGGVDLDIEIESLTVLTVAMATNVDAGDPEELSSCYTAVLERSEPTGELFHRLYAHWGVGIAAWCEGDLARALQLHREALRWALELDDRNGIAWCLEPLAWGAAARGQHTRAATLLGAAAALWSTLGTGPDAFSRLQGYHADCDRQLRDRLGDAAFETALRRGSDLSIPEAVRIALDDKTGRTASGAASTSSAPDDVLTRRERQVAILVAQGRSNKDIAANLVIAQRTAEGHVERIMMKLGFTSRAQVATWVVSQGSDEPGPG